MITQTDLKSHAFIACLALEAAQREVRTLTSKYELPDTEHMRIVQDALNFFRDIVERDDEA